MEENETISGEDARRIVEGEPMRDCYNVQELKLSEDDISDAEIYKAQFGAAANKEAKVGDVVPPNAEMEEAMGMIADEMLAIRQQEEREVFELLLRRKAGLDEDEQAMDEQAISDKHMDDTNPPSQSS